jgi:type VI secretion system secreted protein Hcp
MAIPAYMTIEGETQGEISSGALGEDSVGSYYQEDHEDEIMIQGFQHHIPRGTNQQNGQITSMPLLQPIQITKLMDKASPLLHNALVTGEQLTVTIEWYRISAAGEQEHYYTIEMEEAVLTNIQTDLQCMLTNKRDEQPESVPHMEVLHINPNTITWTHEQAGTEGTYRFGASAS